MHQIDVLYSQSSGSSIRKTLESFGKEVRIAPMVNDSLMAVWVDISARNRFDILTKVCSVLNTAGHEPFLVTHDIYIPTRDVMVEGNTGHLSIYKHDKEYHELLTFGDECKRHLYVKYDTVLADRSPLVEFTHVWLVGNHYTVRKAKRFIANRMSNGNPHLTTHDLERVKQLIGSTGRVYMLSNIGRVIDLVNSRLVTSGGFMPTQRDLMLTNGHVILTGCHVERIRETTNLDNILRSADSK